MEIKLKLLETNLFDESQYLDDYVKLILDNINTKYNSMTTQKHHIIPRYYYKMSGYAVDNGKENTVVLSYKDHILAHYYLALCSKEDHSKFANLMAVQRMIGDLKLPQADKIFIQSLDKYQDLYEQSKVLNSNQHNGRIPWNKGLHYKCGPMKQERKDNISKAAKGRYKGHVWLFNGEISKRVPPEMVPEYEKQGFVRTRDPKTLTKISEAQKKNPGLGMLNKKQSDYQKQVVSNMFKGKPKSPEHRKKIGDLRRGKIKIINLETGHKCYIYPYELEKYIGYVRVTDLNK